MIEIDKRKVYESHGYKFKNFVCLTEEEKKLVLEWRNSPEIRKWMFNSDVITYQSHSDYIKSLEKRTDRYYWLVYTPENYPIGVFDIVNVDPIRNIAETGDYAKPQKFGDGFYFLRECLFFYFNILKIENNYTEADVDNDNIHSLNSFFGIKYNGKKTTNQEGVLKEYLTCDSFTKDIFNERYKLTFRDYLQYLKSYRND